MQIGKTKILKNQRVKVSSLKQHHFTAKKPTAIINSNKLPKDFFAKMTKQSHTLTTKRKRKTYYYNNQYDQTISQRKIISQKAINLNQNFDTPDGAKITSFFGFGPEIHHLGEANDNSFDQIRISEQLLQKIGNKQNNRTKEPYHCQNNLSFGLQPRGSAQLNSPQEQRKQHFTKQQEYRRPMFDCTFAMKPINTVNNIKKIKGKSVHLLRHPTNINNEPSNYFERHIKTITKQNDFKFTAQKKIQSNKSKTIIEKNKTEKRKRLVEIQHQEQLGTKIRLPPISNKQLLFD